MLVRHGLSHLDPRTKFPVAYRGHLAVSLPLGTALAWLLVRTDLPGRRMALLVLGLLPFVPLYLQAAAWQAGFGPQGWCTLASSGPAWLQGWPGAIWIHAMAAVPWVVLIVGAGLRLVEAELEEQALLDGSPRQVFFRVTLRGALPAVGVAALWTAIVDGRRNDGYRPVRHPHLRRGGLHPGRRRHGARAMPSVGGRCPASS